MDANSILRGFEAIRDAMAEHRDELIALDQLTGDGDLGLSMANGFAAVADSVKALLVDADCACPSCAAAADLGVVMMKAAGALNEAAPSTLGTILSFGLMGMAKVLKGRREMTAEELATAMCAGRSHIMAKARSAVGERTVLDSLSPAIDALAAHAGEGLAPALAHAARAAAEGAEATRSMRPVHGRAAYYGERALGNLDGGAVVGQLIFEALRAACREDD